MTPTFNSATTTYTATTANEADKVTATPTEDDAEVSIKLGTADIENGANATWAEGENVLKITVSQYGGSTTYTVTVTAGSAEEES